MSFKRFLFKTNCALGLTAAAILHHNLLPSQTVQPARPSIAPKTVVTTIDDKVAIAPRIAAAPLDPLTVKGHNHYNALLPIIRKTAVEKGIDAKVLALIIAVESDGKPAMRFKAGEKVYMRKYTLPALDPDGKYHLNKQLRTLYQTHLQNGWVRDEAQFAQLLSSGIGVAQIQGLGAFETGYRGNLNDLMRPEVGIPAAADYLKKRCGKQLANPVDASVSYNGGLPGHRERAQEWLQLIEGK